MSENSGAKGKSGAAHWKRRKALSQSSSPDVVITVWALAGGCLLEFLAEGMERCSQHACVQ